MKRSVIIDLSRISIHAPREGGDFMFLRRGPVTL